MKEYLSSIQDVLKEQNTSEEGLSSQEAASRLEKFGHNKLKEGKKDSLLKKFLDELADPMIIILIVAAVISGITAYYEGESFADVIIIMAGVIINSSLVLLTPAVPLPFFTEPPIPVRLQPCRRLLQLLVRCCATESLLH